MTAESVLIRYLHTKTISYVNRTALPPNAVDTNRNIQGIREFIVGNSEEVRMFMSQVKADLYE